MGRRLTFGYAMGLFLSSFHLVWALWVCLCFWNIWYESRGKAPMWQRVLLEDPRAQGVVSGC